MKAIIRAKAGKDFSTMQITSLDSPQPKEGEIKIKMAASRINPVDMDLMKGFPTIKYKNPQVGGIDGSGTVMELGKGVTHFNVGDHVMFYRFFSDIGTWAEEITINAKDCALVPNSIKVQQAGSIALPLLTAYDSLMQLNPKRGEKILIHGVAGGVGFQALQIAKQLGLYVIGTASATDKTILQEAGIDQLIDYKSADFTSIIQVNEIDYVFDVLGGETLTKSILLLPRKIISIKFIAPNNMYKAGVRLPSFLKWIMTLMSRKHAKLAKRNNVQIIGQVTGADGQLLQKAIDMISTHYIPRSFNSITFAEIESRGLNSQDIGKVILF